MHVLEALGWVANRPDDGLAWPGLDWVEGLRAEEVQYFVFAAVSRLAVLCVCHTAPLSPRGVALEDRMRLARCQLVPCPCECECESEKDVAAFKYELASPDHDLQYFLPSVVS